MTDEDRRLADKANARSEPPSMAGVAASDLIDARQIAAILGVSPFTAAEWMRTGRLPSVKLGRYRRSTRAWLDAWIEERREGGQR